MFSASVFACNYELQIKKSNDVSIDNKVIRNLFSTQLETLGYYPGSGKYLIKSTISLTRDHHNPKKYLSKTSLSLYKNNNMENYTQGFGRPKNTISSALNLKQISKSIKAAIDNLPACN
jgi:hypothetical protein